MPNHWDRRCSCSHRKGSHQLIYGPGFSGLQKIGHCVVVIDANGNPDRTGTSREVCRCEGYTDDVNWNNGERILHGD